MHYLLPYGVTFNQQDIMKVDAGATQTYIEPEHRHAL